MYIHSTLYMYVYFVHEYKNEMNQKTQSREEQGLIILGLLHVHVNVYRVPTVQGNKLASFVV